MLDDETGILPLEALGHCNPNAYDGFLKTVIAYG